jgi:hypothetical protein
MLAVAVVVVYIVGVDLPYLLALLVVLEAAVLVAMEQQQLLV